MQITLRPSLKRYVEEQVRAGRYASAEDVMAAAVGRLMQDEDSGDFAPGELNALIARAEAQFRRGEGLDAADVFEEIRRDSKEFRQRGNAKR